MKASLTINIWTEGRKRLPADLSDLAELFVPHLEHVRTYCEQGYQAGEILDENFSGWWTVKTD